MTIAENALKAAAEAQLAIDAVLRRRLEALRKQLINLWGTPLDVVDEVFGEVVDELDAIIAELGGGISAKGGVADHEKALRASGGEAVSK